MPHVRDAEDALNVQTGDFAALLATPRPARLHRPRGAAGEELARMLSRYLRASRPRRPDEETVELVREWAAGEAPLVALRTRRGVTRDSVVDAVMRAFGLPEEKRAKVKRYYHELEAGPLDPARLKEELVEVLAQALRTQRSKLFVLRASPFDLEPLPMFRAVEAPAAAADSTFAKRSQRPQTDQVDRLFGIDF